MNTSNNKSYFPWVPRKATDDLYGKIIRAAAEPSSSVHIYLVVGPAGSGKTFLGRDLGVRLGSLNGYDPGQQGTIFWPGILDVFDPSTNSNQGLEARVIQGLKPFGFKFKDYLRERELYDLRFKTGYHGPSMEKQRHTIEQAFAKDLAEVSNQGYPVIPIDTIERLESSTDPTQQELGLQSDTASVVGWLLFQISELQRGAFIFLGRKTSYFHTALQEAVQTAQQHGKRITLERINLESLAAEDMDIFYEYRTKQFSELKAILGTQVRNLLENGTGRNPLLMDMALQALREAPNPKQVLETLQGGPGDLSVLQEKLLEVYLDVLAKPSRKSLLHYLAVARNGLFEELLHALEPRNAHALMEELHSMEELPFIKVRDLYMTLPGQRERMPRRTYFLHDEMYLLYDRQIKKEPTIAHRICEDSLQIADWYDKRIKETRELDKLRVKGLPPNPAANDLIVESLLYRLRANPRQGYEWFLYEEDRAIRNSISIGLDMRLRDAMGQFINSAFPKSDEQDYSLASPVDQFNISENAPDLPEKYQVDSAMLWVKRFSARGNQREAIFVAEKLLPTVDDLYQQSPILHDISLAELLLWYGQALMYNARNDEAMKQYERVLHLFETNLSTESLRNLTETRHFDPHTIWRLCLVLGRTLNNQGYLSWRNKGQYRLAIQYFQQAIPTFRFPSAWDISGLEEEIANTTDNIARVYSRLGNQSPAKELARQALEQRKNLGLSYRAALSNNSLAIILANSGQFDQALEAVDDAILEFRGAEAGRGVGISSITRGSILRRRAENWHEINQPVSTAARDTETAEADLRQAADIFADEIAEPIHLVEVYNELGCCLRARYLIQLQHSNTNTTYLAAILSQGEASLTRSIQDAQKYNFSVEMLDSIQDLSVLYFRADRLDEAEECVRKIEEIITSESKDYIIQEGKGLIRMPKEICVDAYYKLLGLNEMMKGAITYQRGVRNALPGGMVLDRDTYLQTAQYYIFAVVYFTHFSNQAYALDQTFGRMYKRFQKCELDVQTEITGKLIPDLLGKYNLPEDPIRSLMADIFGYFL